MWWLTDVALACAGFVHDPAAVAESAFQEAVLQRTADGSRITYEVDVTIDTASFGWVIPVPGEVTAVSDGDPALFDRLRSDTAPLLHLQAQRQGCFGASKGDGLNDTGDVTVVYEGSTPTWDYVVLEASDGAAMDAWLTDHGWTLGPSDVDLAAYVDEGGFQVLALALSADDPGESVQADLPPLQIDYAGDRLLFPARMARHAEAPRLNTVLWVLGDQRATMSGWDAVDLPFVWDIGEDPEYVQYQAYPDAVGEIGDGRGYAVTWSGAFDGDDGVTWATRFETRASRETHDTDVVVALDGGQVELRMEIGNVGGCAAPQGAAFMPAGLLLPLLLRRRR